MGESTKFHHNEDTNNALLISHKEVMNISDGQEKEINSELSSVSKKPKDSKYILYYFGKNEGWNPHKYLDLSKCQVSDSVLTADEKLLGSVGNFVAIVVHHVLFDFWRKHSTRYSSFYTKMHS